MERKPNLSVAVVVVVADGKFLFIQSGRSWLPLLLAGCGLSNRGRGRRDNFQRKFLLSIYETWGYKDDDDDDMAMTRIDHPANHEEQGWGIITFLLAVRGDIFDVVR